MRRYTLEVSGQNFVVDVDETGVDAYAVTIDGETYAVRLAADGTFTPPVVLQPSPRPLSAAVAHPPPLATAGGQSVVKAPMPGVILEVAVKVGERVERGQTVAVLDAMKMHTAIGAPRAGVVAEVLASEGLSVAYGDPIVRLAED